VEEIGKALVKLIEQGSDLAPSIMSYWFIVRMVDNLASVLIAGVVMVGLWAITKTIVACVDRSFRS